MKEFFTILWAHIRCEAYLLVNFWRGECKFVARGRGHRVEIIAAVTGSLFKKTLACKRVFYDPQGLTQNESRTS